MPRLFHSARHRAPGRTGPIRVLTLSSVVAASVVAAVMVSGGTYAMWNGRQPIPSVTVSSGTIAVTATAAFTASQWSNMLPGETVRQEFTLANTGDATVAVSASATTGTSSFEIRLATGACGTIALTGPSATVTPTSLGTLAKDASTTVCLEVELTSTARPGDASDFGVALTGAQIL